MKIFRIWWISAHFIDNHVCRVSCATGMQGNRNGDHAAEDEKRRAEYQKDCRMQKRSWLQG